MSRRDMKMNRWYLTFILCCALLSACASAPQSSALLADHPETFPSSVRLANIPFFPQEDYQCGPAALATVLVASDIETSADDLVPMVYVPERQGSFQIELVAAARSFGRLVYEIDPAMEALLTEVSAGHPVLVMQNLGLNWYPQWHFAVVKGFDLTRGVMLLNSDVREDYEVAMRTFERTWARAERWAIVVLEPGTLPQTADPARYFAAVATLENNNDARTVLPAYEEGLRRWSTDRNLLMGHGNLLYAEGDLVSASRSFMTAVEHHSDYAPAHNNLAHVLHSLGNSIEAMPHARKAVEIGGEFIDSYRQTLRNIEGVIP